MDGIDADRGCSWLRRQAARNGFAAALTATLLAGCAPDSVRSVEATGFNAYLQKLGQVCQPLLIGDANVGEWIRYGAVGNNNYDYFVDATSKLYYNRLTPAGYRQAVVGFLGPGTPNDRSFDCIFRNLPPDRPSAPVGTY
jgi:hypothetical protein